jgi:DNA-binding transcriptional LysR family regulator
MNNWNEIRTAYKLAKIGTLSATAEVLGVHRSTVMRHIDTLEESLGITLFQRSDKGYRPTEAGLDIMRLGEVTDNQFSQLSSRLKNSEQILEGTLTITIVSEMVSILMPAIKHYQVLYPEMNVELVGDIRNFNLEYGEADIAIRAGDKPTTPDNIVRPLLETQLVLCAHKEYVAQYGLASLETLSEHRFIALKDRPEHLVWNEWIHNNIAEKKIAILASSQQLLTHALFAGCGIGVLPKDAVADNDELVEIPMAFDWQISIWALVHRDMLNMPKIKKFLDILREQKSWPMKFM